VLRSRGMRGAARRALLLTALPLLAALSAVRAEAASYPPELRFRTISTDKVSVHFHQGFEPMARQAATLATAPAILNGICHASGARVRTVPATPERVLAALREAGSNR